MLIRKKKLQQGFTTIELLIGTAISAILLVGLVTLLTGFVRYNKETFGLNRFHQEALKVLYVVERDIRRAGYWGNAINDIGTATVTNPFAIGGNDVQIGSGNSCILFAYDSNKDGTLPALGTAGDDERYGYRLSSSTIQTRTPSGNFSCDNATGWVNLTDPLLMAIYSLQFNMSSTQTNIDSGGSRINQRSIQINMTAGNVKIPSMVKNYSHTVKLRNDAFILN